MDPLLPSMTLLEFQALAKRSLNPCASSSPLGESTMNGHYHTRDVPIRPMPPRLFLCGLVFWGTAALLIIALRTAEPPSPSFFKVLCAAFFITAAFFVVVQKKRSSLWRLIICSCFLGIVIGLAHATSMTSISSELMASSITEGTLSLKEDARENRFGNQALCDLVTSDGNRYRVLAVT